MKMKIEVSKADSAWPADIKYPVLVADKYDLEELYLVTKNDSEDGYLWIDLTPTDDGVTFNFTGKYPPNAEGWVIYNGTVMLSND
jgi:hypothetical protein